MERDSPLTFCSSSQNKSSLFPWLGHRGPIYNRGVGMELFPDHSVPKLGRREVTSLGLTMGAGGLRQPGLTGGQEPEQLSGWDSFQEVRVIDTHFQCRTE